MKLISKGLVNKILRDIDDEQLSKSKGSIDNMGLAFATKTHPYRNPASLSKNPMNDPNLFIVNFQRIL